MMSHLTLISLSYTCMSQYTRLRYLSLIQLNLCKTVTLVFKTNYRLMQVKIIAECSKGSILQYFRPSLRYHLSLISNIFVLSIFEWPFYTSFSV